MMKRCIWLGYRGVISRGTGWAVEVLLYSVSRGPLPQRAATSRRSAVGDHMALHTASQALRGVQQLAGLLLCTRLQQHYAAVVLGCGVVSSRLP